MAFTRHLYKLNVVHDEKFPQNVPGVLLKITRGNTRGVLTYLMLAPFFR